MAVCRVSYRGLKLIYQMNKDLLDFFKREEEREGKEKIYQSWQSLSKVEVDNYKEIIKKIRRLTDRIEEYIDEHSKEGRSGT